MVLEEIGIVLGVIGIGISLLVFAIQIRLDREVNSISQKENERYRKRKQYWISNMVILIETVRNGITPLADRFKLPIQGPVVIKHVMIYGKNREFSSFFSYLKLNANSFVDVLYDPKLAIEINSFFSRTEVEITTNLNEPDRESIYISEIRFDQLDQLATALRAELEQDKISLLEPSLEEVETSIQEVSWGSEKD